MDYSSIILIVLYYIAYPVFYILHFILSILAIVTAPLLHLGHYSLYACYYPIHVLGKFETLYIFFGVAVFVGVLTGTSLHYASSFMVSMLHLESQPEEQRGKTLASYRKEKQDKRNTDPSLKLSYGRGGRGRGNDAVSGRNSMDADRSPLDTQRNFKQRREGQRIDAMLNQEPMDFEWPKQGRGRAKNDLIPNTILEEDSAEDGF